jgi:hypothetical protein
VKLSAFASDIALAEIGVPARALSYVRSGFRAFQPAGAFGYDGGGNASVVLVACAVLAIPELLVLDFVSWHAPGWRIANGVAHVYLIVWALGLAQAFRSLPHVVDDQRATFRSLFFRSVTVARDAVASAEVVEVDRRAAWRALRFGVGRPQRYVRVVLREPAQVERWLAAPCEATSFLVAADDPVRLARTLTTAP